MQDVNNHDNQDLLNNRIAHVLADTITGLTDISNDMDVEPQSLYKQFLGSYVLFINIKMNTKMSILDKTISNKKGRVTVIICFILVILITLFNKNINNISAVALIVVWTIVGYLEGQTKVRQDYMNKLQDK